MKPVTFFARTDIVVIGANPENADYTNPRGEIHGYAALVVAESAQGDRRELCVGSDRLESNVLPQAEAMAAALCARLASGRLPVAFERWRAGRPGYGSEAYQAYGQADDVELERREAAEEAWA
jgi:hypothetical protein